MITDSSENYTIGYKKYENLLKEIFDDNNKYYTTFRTLTIGLLILFCLNLLFNGWISRTEILIRACMGTAIFTIAYFLGTGFPKKKISEPFHPDNYPFILQTLKKYNQISILKVIRSILFFTIILLGLQVFALLDTKDIITTFSDRSWKEGLLDFTVILVFITAAELIRHYRTFARLKEIEQHII